MQHRCGVLARRHFGDLHAWLCRWWERLQARDVGVVGARLRRCCICERSSSNMSELGACSVTLDGLRGWSGLNTQICALGRGTDFEGGQRDARYRPGAGAAKQLDGQEGSGRCLRPEVAVDILSGRGHLRSAWRRCKGGSQQLPARRRLAQVRGDERLQHSCQDRWLPVFLVQGLRLSGGDARGRRRLVPVSARVARLAAGARGRGGRCPGARRRR
mmetsp:Transcript_11271/g.30165  ORF Transcript_11271/g.30165 Transcript_11271/m.30165 type:complete len:216 (+) Transcript_11271:747-1394(+)